MTIYRAIRLATVALFGLPVVITNCYSEEFPLLEVAIGWPLDKLAKHSPDVVGLPMHASDHVGSYLNTIVRFHYAGDTVQFNIPQTHAFTVQQEDGHVSAIDVELPLVMGDPEPAFAELRDWSDKFDEMKIRRFYDSTGNCGRHDDIQAARKIINHDFGMSGATVGCWQDQGAIYSLGITRFKRHIVARDSSEQVISVYKVVVSIWDQAKR